MANPIQYGDPGVVDWWKRQLAKSMQFSYDPWGSAGGVLDWLSAPHGPAGVSFIGGGSAYTPPGAGAMGYDPAQEMQYMGLGSKVGGPQLRQTGDISPGAPRLGHTGQLGTGGLSPYISDTGLASTAGVNPLLASTQPVQYGPPLPPPETGTTPAAGQREPISYETIREMEAGLKAAGYTGRDVFLPNKDEQDRTVSYDIIRRDNQGRVLRITRGVSGQTADLAFAGRSKNVGGGPGAKTEMRRHRGQERRVKTTGEKYSWQVPQPAPAPAPAPVSGNNYPNWVINMSNWRGI